MSPREQVAYDTLRYSGLFSADTHEWDIAELACTLVEVLDQEPGGEQYLSVRESARRLQVHENTVRNWIKKGVLHDYRVPGTVFNRLSETEVNRLATNRGDTDV